MNLPGDIFATVQVTNDATADGQGMFITHSIVIGDA